MTTGAEASAMAPSPTRKSRIRFETAAAVFEAFDTAAVDVGEPPTEERPSVFLKRLMAKTPPLGAVGFLAHALPKREAVWWACRAVSNLTGVAEGADKQLAAAEAWVREPDEARRRAALEAAMMTASLAPGRWCAFAAGWSSGSSSLDETLSAPVQPHMTAHAVYIAVLRAADHIGYVDYAARLKACVASGAAFAEGDPLNL